MENIEIKEISSVQANEYKAFFIRGLIEDEESFRISPNDEREAQFPTTGSVDSFTLAAYVDQQLAGVVSLAREGKDREKLRHKALLFRMYVSSSHRGKGIARRLIEKAIERAQQVDDIERIVLTVIGHNDKAKSLYQSLGFEIYGSEPKALKWKDKYFDEDLMALELRKKMQ